MGHWGEWHLVLTGARGCWASRLVRRTVAKPRESGSSEEQLLKLSTG